MSVIDKVAGLMDIERMAEVFCQVRRKQLATDIADISPDMTEADAYHMIRQMEADVVRDFDKEEKNIPDVGLKLMAQTALVSLLQKEADDGTEEGR